MMFRIKMIRFVPAVLGLSLLFPARALLAQQPEAEKAEEKQEQEKPDEAERNFVVTVEESLPFVADRANVATKLSNDLQDIPASVTVVSHPLFRSQDAVILSDALRNVSGVNLQSNFGVHDYFLIRGFDSLSTGLVLTDGAAEPEATYYNLYNVEQVEVLKGPAAFLYGGNPLSGVVNLTRKQPQFNTFMQAVGTIGAFGTFRGQADFNLGSEDSPAAFRLNVMGQESEGYRELENHQVAVNPALTWKLSDDTQLTFNFEYVTNQFTPDAGIPLLGNTVPDVPRTRSYGSPFDVSDQDIYRARVDWTHRLTDSITLRNKFYYTDLEWRSDGTLLSGVFPNAQGGLDVQRFLNLLNDRQKLAGNQFEAIFNFFTGPVKHELLTGFEAGRLGDEFTLDVAFLPPLDLFNPVETAREPFFFLPDQSLIGDSRSLVLAPYFVDQIHLTEKVRVFVGGRLDHIDFEDDPRNDQRTDNRFSPMVGFLAAPNKGLSLYVNAGQSFAPPSTLVTGDRAPEESRQYEAGVKKKFGDALKATLAFYHLERDNIAIPDATGVTRRQGDERSRGVELELAAAHTPFWHSFVNYAYNDTELRRFAEFGLVSFFPPVFGVLDRSGNRAPFAPRHIFNAWTTKEFANGIGIGGGARYVSGQFIAPDNNFQIDDYLSFDAVISMRLEHWRLSFNIKNLTDRNYENRGFGVASVIPADAFGVYGTIQFTM